jgi:hypothetical protein
MDTIAESPRFTHDCDVCIFLGRFKTSEWCGKEEEVDLYVCRPEKNEETTLVARFGNEGHEYGSGLCFCVSSPHYAEACRRAINCGHLNEDFISGNASHEYYLYPNKERLRIANEAKAKGEEPDWDELFKTKIKTLGELMDEYFGKDKWRTNE